MFRCGSSSRIDSSNAFTILFEVPAANANASTDAGTEEATNNDQFTYYSSSSSSSSSPVDCTLSLGSASTRQSKSPTNTTNSSNGSTCIPNTIYWDILAQAKQMRSPASSRATAYDAAPGIDGDSLLSRRCANCNATSTPLWRNGPRGPKSLCNACGIRYKKEERRAAAAAAATFTSPSLSPIQPPTAIDSQHRNGMNYGYTHSHPWTHAPVTASRMRSGATSISMSSSSGRLPDDNDGENSGMPYYSWCLDAPTPSRPKFLHP